MIYKNRVLEQKLREYLTHFSVVGITGPRQSGKSTLLKHVLTDYQYVTFDDPLMVDLFSTDPKRFMRIYENKVIFDEVQRVPELFNYIKIAVDEDRSVAGKFVLTGSSQFSFIKGVTESLAGRIGLLTQLPFQLSEMPADLIDESIFKGSYPELVGKRYALGHDWYASYLDTYLLKDVSSLVVLGDKRDFLRLIKMLAAQTSQVLNVSRIAADIGVDAKTIKRWISVLEASYIIFLLPPYFRNYGKRIVKSPKVYFHDTGLVSYLTGLSTRALFENGPMAGSLFENYIVSEIVKRELHTKTHAELFYIRTTNGEEVDVVVDRKTKRELIEIKHSETFHSRMTKAIEEFSDSSDEGYVLYRGKNMPYLPNINVMNFKEYLKAE